ncbi:MAG: TetR/AcrR family transcriptional regulator [Catenulispora sp.]|nr:TetR/AcrR family transcriptional regulator [Catenulispora sp.]
MAAAEPAPDAAPDNPGRADAQRNRQRLIEAAQRAFTSGDGKVSLEAVAKQAGVGIGTLYRHFPTREALVEAVYLTERTRLCQAADELLTAQPPQDALRSWMDRFADYIATKREMADALRALIADGTITGSQARAELSAAVHRILIAGAAAGTIRKDVAAEDVVVALVGIFSVCSLPGQREQAGRLLDLLMDGLRQEERH